MRRGFGRGLGKGYRNMMPLDSHIHSLSAKGVSLYLKGSCEACNPKTFYAKHKEHIFYCPNCEEEKEFREEEASKGLGSDPADTETVYVCPKCDYMIDNEYFYQKAEDERAEREMEARWEADYEKKKGHKLKAGTIPDLARAIALSDGKPWDMLTTQEHFDYFTKAESKNKANIQAPKNVPQRVKIPTVQILPAKEFDKKFKDDYEEWEQGYATTKVSGDGTAKIYVRDDQNGDYTREGKLLMHELKELEIFDDLIHNKGVDPNIADEMAHNMNPVKVEGVSDTYPIDPHN